MSDIQLKTEPSAFKKLWDRIEAWANKDFYVPAFFMGTGSVSELVSYLNFESTPQDIFLADRETTSLKPDLLIISGLVNYKSLRNLKATYELLSGKKYVVILGGMTDNCYGLNDYNLVTNLDDHFPVDLVIHGNPPTREEIISGLNSLKDIR
jgi:NADH:ubiquinone oxidoreductase subunit B-like Fe-S oxidoreductase